MQNYTEQYLNADDAHPPSFIYYANKQPRYTARLWPTFTNLNNAVMKVKFC